VGAEGEHPNRGKGRRVRKTSEGMADGFKEGLAEGFTRPTPALVETKKGGGESAEKEKKGIRSLPANLGLTGMSGVGMKKRKNRKRGTVLRGAI